MRNPIHRKKLQLCLNGLCTQQIEANNLDTYWVLSMCFIQIIRRRKKKLEFLLVFD